MIHVHNDNAKYGGGVRRSYLDLAKLITVLCVVHNHAKTIFTPVSDVINILIMPAFFIFYGMAVSERSVKGKEWISFLESRTKALIIPYVLWALIYSARRDWTFWKNLFIGNNPTLGRAQTNMVLWFLPCMFVSVLLYQLYSNIYSSIKKGWIRWCFVAGAMILCIGVSHYFNGYVIGGRFFGWDIAFLGCMFMILGRKTSEIVERAKDLPNICKFALAAIGFLITYFIAETNMAYSAWTGTRATTMALSIYGRLDLFIIGSFVGTLSVILISMLFEKNALLVWMGQFSMVIMAIHYILYIFVLPQCNKVLSLEYGAYIQPSLVAMSVFLLCIPLCFIINWACPELNGKVVKIPHEQLVVSGAKDTVSIILKTIIGVIVFMLMFFCTSLISYVCMAI